MNVSLSCSWNSFRHTSGYAVIDEIIPLGFPAIELAFNLTSAMADEIAQYAPKQNLSISSVHNYCPIPDSLSRKEALPDVFAMSSQDEEQRKKAVFFTKRSIDTAAKLNAKAVVLHCGRVEIPDRTRELIELYNAGKKNTTEFVSKRDDIVLERQKVSAAFLNNTLRSLDELNSYAAKNKIILGVETRYYHREIPNLEELNEIFKRFHGSNLCYWHDSGHAQLMENLGFYKHIDFLSQNADYLKGIHLHNIVGCKDHKPPQSGEIDFTMLKPFIKTDTLKVIEAHYPAPANDIIEAKNFITRIFNGNS